MCSTPCKIRSTHCKICSTKQSYPQVIPRVIPKKVLPHANVVPKTCKRNIQYPCKICSTKQSYPSYPQSYPLQKVLPNAKYDTTQNTQYIKCKHAVPPAKYHSTHCKICKPHAKYAVLNKVIPNYPQSYPQWICRRKMDFEKIKVNAFILT